MRQRVMCIVCNFCGTKVLIENEDEEHPENWFAMNVKDSSKGARPVRKHVCDGCAGNHSLSEIKQKLCEDSQTMLIL